MKRCWLGLALLLGLLLAGLPVTKTVTEKNEVLEARLEAVSEAAFGEDWAEAEAQLTAAKRKWDGNWRFFAVFSDHEPMEEMDGLFSQAEVYLQSRNPEALAAVCAQLAAAAAAMGDAHALNWWNLL